MTEPIPWDRICQLMDDLRSAGLDTRPLEQVIGYPELPPKRDFVSYMDRLENYNLKGEYIAGYIINIYYLDHPKPVITIFYNEEHSYTIDTCTTNYELLLEVINRIKWFSEEVRAIIEVEDYLKRIRRLLYRVRDKPYYGEVADLVIKRLTESVWVNVQ